MRIKKINIVLGLFLFSAGLFAQSAVVVTDPRGGTKWEQYKAHVVTFYTTNCAGYGYRVWLTPTWTQIVGNGYVSSDTYRDIWWTVPGTVPAGDGYRIYVEIFSGDYTITSGYSSYFSVSPWIPSHINVTYPNLAGVSWERGSQHTITWTTDGDPISNVKIEIVKGISYQLIAASAPNTGSYTWTVPSDQELRPDCLIGITATNNESVRDYSDNQFAIVPATTVNKPNLVYGSYSCVPSTFTEGQSASIRFVVRNSGVASSPASHARLTVSPGNDINKSDDYWVPEKKSVPALSPGSETMITWSLSSFPDMGSGSYNVWFVIDLDCDSEVSESNESNTYIVDYPTYVQTASSVWDSEGNQPCQFSLQQNSPNPFNPETRIQFQTGKYGNVRLEVFNMMGQRIRVLCDQVLETGQHARVWDGLDENGRNAASGVYLAVLSQDGIIQKCKMIKID